MNIGFDFDKVFINYPPFIPNTLVDLLYKGIHKNKKNIERDLEYRFPGLLEQKIRIASHHKTFRKPIVQNIKSLERLHKNEKAKLFLVSSRYGFLKKATESILDIYKLRSSFNEITFNYKNEQPHKFKARMIRKLKIDMYIDDDLDLTLFLSATFPSLKIFWITNTMPKIELPKNITRIKNLKEFERIYLKDYATK